MTDHLRPTAPIAPVAVLPGDPGRALALAQDLLDSPRMANHARGLWGYTGLTPAGVELTVQSTGIGGPSVAIVLEELASLGVRRAIRLGTCSTLDGEISAGELVLAARALAPGGEAAGVLEGDPGLVAALASDLRPVTVAGTDRYYEPDRAERREGWIGAGAQVLDLGTAAILEVGARLEVEVASVLVVARDENRTLSDEEVEGASLKLGHLASAALLS